MPNLEPLLGKTLIVVAHPDDEVIACGGLMQQMQQATVLFATDGAPRDEYFWKDYGSREEYAAVRRREAVEALSKVKAEPMFLSDLVAEGIADQELFRLLNMAFTRMQRVLGRNETDCLLTLAYEGGHPDHDAACFLTWLCGQKTGLPVWEAPLYHRDSEGKPAFQTFHQSTGAEQLVRIEGEMLEQKLAMFHSYRSQKLVVNGFRPEVEQFRPMAGYDFTRPPFPWKLNYELWQWPMTGQQVADSFSELLRENSALAAG
jgi:LmbE family N-acetylglucosaminyl deacetylase